MKTLRNIIVGFDDTTKLLVNSMPTEWRRSGEADTFVKIEKLFTIPSDSFDVSPYIIVTHPSVCLKQRKDTICTFRNWHDDTLCFSLLTSKFPND